MGVCSCCSQSVSQSVCWLGVVSQSVSGQLTRVHPCLFLAVACGCLVAWVESHDFSHELALCSVLVWERGARRVCTKRCFAFNKVRGSCCVHACQRTFAARHLLQPAVAQVRQTRAGVRLLGVHFFPRAFWAFFSDELMTCAQQACGLETDSTKGGQQSSDGAPYGHCSCSSTPSACYVSLQARSSSLLCVGVCKCQQMMKVQLKFQHSFLGTPPLK